MYCFKIFSNLKTSTLIEINFNMCRSFFKVEKILKHYIGANSWFDNL
jgi:hypothetical protein